MVAPHVGAAGLEEGALTRERTVHWARTEGEVCSEAVRLVKKTKLYFSSSVFEERK